MDTRIKNLKSELECSNFEANAVRLNHLDLAKQAKLRLLELKAEAKGAETLVEKEALQAIFAYEQVLSLKHGKPTRAGRTWPMISKHGIIGGVERVVNRPVESAGYTALAEMGLEDFAFEAVILRYPEEFSDSAVQISQRRMEDWKNN
jgi:hypothetical protein